VVVFPTQDSNNNNNKVLPGITDLETVIVTAVNAVNVVNAISTVVRIVVSEEERVGVAEDVSANYVA